MSSASDTWWCVCVCVRVCVCADTPASSAQRVPTVVAQSLCLSLSLSVRLSTRPSAQSLTLCVRLGRVCACVCKEAFTTRTTPPTRLCVTHHRNSVLHRAGWCRCRPARRCLSGTCKSILATLLLSAERPSSTACSLCSPPKTPGAAPPACAAAAAASARDRIHFRCGGRKGSEARQHFNADTLLHQRHLSRRRLVQRSFDGS